MEGASSTCVGDPVSAYSTYMQVCHGARLSVALTGAMANAEVSPF